MIKARVKFNKSGTMKFIGHLDVMRYFQKAIRRADIDVAYSQGFSPHQLLSFASPLGVGLTSDAEYMDVQLNSLSSLEDMKQKMNAVMSMEMQILEITTLAESSKPAMAALAAADYLVSLKDGYPAVTDFEKRFQEFYNQESILITKKTKKREIQMDLKSYIYKYAYTRESFYGKPEETSAITTAQEYKNGQKVYLQLICGSVVNIKPEQVMEAFLAYLGESYNPFAYQIHRMELYADTNAPKGEANPNGCGKERHLVPLSNYGK